MEYLRATGSPADREVTRLLARADSEVVTTAPVQMELLAGANGSAALRGLEALTAGLTSLPLEVDRDFHAAAAVYRAAREGGATVRSTVDCLIAVVAARHGAVVVHRDRDFEVLAAVLPGLRTRSLT